MSAALALSAVNWVNWQLWSAAWPAALVACVTTACATALLARVARRIGWTDDGAAERARKLQARPVPLVGGTAIILGLCAGELCARARGGAGVFGELTGGAVAFPFGALEVDARAWWLAAASAFAVGLADDLLPRGLSAWQKLAGQLLPACALLAGARGPLEPATALIVVWAVVTAQNAVNTFDNADGAASAVCALGLVPGAPLAAAAVAAFLPFNLWLKQNPQRASATDGVPARERAGTVRAYLGDGGSHLLAILLLASPLGWSVLIVPLFDLARVSWLRVRAGGAPWIGDRRHLAHRLAAAGRTPSAVVVLLVCACVPMLACAWLALRSPHAQVLLAAGMLVSAGAIAWSLRRAPQSA